MNKEEQDILFYAFRYALGRRTAVVSQMVGILTNRWHRLSRFNRDQIKLEIGTAIEQARIGDTCDREEWEKILELSSS